MVGVSGWWVLPSGGCWVLVGGGCYQVVGGGWWVLPSGGWWVVGFTKWWVVDVTCTYGIVGVEHCDSFLETIGKGKRNAVSYQPIHHGAKGETVQLCTYVSYHAYICAG